MALLKLSHVKHLDSRLRLRLYLYFAISILLIGAVVFEIVSGRVSPTLATIGFLTGLVIGVIVARMFLISWDKDAKRVISRLDEVGIVILIVYILIAVVRSRVISQFVESDYVTGTSIAVITGIMVGRVFGTGRKIVKILHDQHLL